MTRSISSTILFGVSVLEQIFMSGIYWLAPTVPLVSIAVIFYIICFGLVVSNPTIVIALFVLIGNRAVVDISYLIIPIQLINYSEGIDQAFRCAWSIIWFAVTLVKVLLVTSIVIQRTNRSPYITVGKSISFVNRSILYRFWYTWSIILIILINCISGVGIC